MILAILDSGRPLQCIWKTKRFLPLRFMAPRWLAFREGRPAEATPPARINARRLAELPIELWLFMGRTALRDAVWSVKILFVHLARQRASDCTLRRRRQAIGPLVWIGMKPECRTGRVAAKVYIDAIERDRQPPLQIFITCRRYLRDTPHLINFSGFSSCVVIKGNVGGSTANPNIFQH